MLTRLFIMALLLAGIFAAPAEARELPLPKDPDKFTSFMADRFSEANAGSNVKVVGPLRLDLNLPGGKDTIYLDNIWHACESDRRHCRKAIAEFVTNMSGAIKERTADIKASDIRAIVRSALYADDARKMAIGKPERMPVVRPVAGELWMVCVVDLPHGIRTLQHADLAKLGLTEDQAIALALKNIAAALPPLETDTHVVKQYGLKFAAGDFYESSRMLLHDSWAEMSKAMGGHLVIAVPSHDFLIYGNGATKDDRVPLAAFARMVVDKAQKPMTATLFEWTKAGWEMVAP